MPRTAHPRPSLLAAYLIALAAGTACGQGRIIIDDPPVVPRPRPGPGQTALLLKSQRVETSITDGVASTAVTQTFKNPLHAQIEGTYIFPLPDGVAVGDFEMTVGGKTLRGEVLDAETARRTYEEIVRRTRDPGLLEYLGGRLFRARVFPIPPDALVDVRLQYSLTLTEQDGLGLYRHTLRADAPADQPVDQLVIQVKLKSSVPLTSVFCPSHACAIERRGDYEAAVSFEANRIQVDRDFLLYYQRRDAAFGVVLLTHRGAGEPGTFLLRISPRVELPADQTLPKDIAFVIDTSGSMAGQKLEQAKAALRFCINGLNANDRFNLYAFSTAVHPFREALAFAGEDVKRAAEDFVRQLSASGGTNIDAALAAALDDDPRDDRRVYLIVVMTDGQPTVGVRDPEQIVRAATQKNARHTRFHVLGVGADVNTHLLDRLAEATRGARDYCTENEELELKLSGFVQRFAHPVLTNLALRIDGASVSDVYPQPLPDLFRGTELVVLGRYDGAGPARVRLTGQIAGAEKVIEQETTFPRVASDNDFLPRLWANRKVAYLLDQIRLHGSSKELVDEVVRLAKRYGIVTPYTSALIVEEQAQNLRGGPAGRSRALSAAVQAGARAAPAGAAGTGAVEYARDLVRRQQQTVVTEGESDAYRNERGERVIRCAADKTFVLVDGRWTDTAWDEQRAPVKVVAFSDEYFALVRSNPQLSRFLALGEHVLVVLADTVYEIVPATDNP